MKIKKLNLIKNLYLIIKKNRLESNFPHPKIIKKLKKVKKILIDDGKFLFKVIGKSKNSVITKCKSQNCIKKIIKVFIS